MFWAIERKVEIKPKCNEVAGFAFLVWHFNVIVRYFAKDERHRFFMWCTEH